ncbi:TIGR03564 family F420-dependent LLM class oxidoreductase [Streptomyces mirabilis]
MSSRVLIAKPGLDGHDRGAKIVARTLRDAGFEVVFTGIRQRVDTIVATALQEDVAVVGLSILSGAHLALTTRVVEGLRAAGAEDIAVVVGGTIPPDDVPRMKAAGAAAVFPTGTPLDAIVAQMRALTAVVPASPATPLTCRRRTTREAGHSKYRNLETTEPRNPGTPKPRKLGGTVRVGVMIGPERGDSARKVARMIDDVTWAERAGLDTAWVPQIPTDFDALTAVALMGARTERIEIGTAVVPLQTQHPIALARQALSAQGAANGRLALGLGPSHHWIVQDMLGLPYERPAAFTRDYLEVLDAALRGPGPVDVENGTFTVHNPLDLGPVAPLPVLLAALGPVMLALAGERADGTVLWMADERAVADHVVPRITKAADGAGRPAPRIVAGIPVCLCRPGEVDAARERANRILGEAEISPNYQRLLDYGDARDIGDLCAAGDERAIAARFRRFADAGVTDLSVRLLPIGEGREELIASKRRTREVLAGIAADFR